MLTKQVAKLSPIERLAYWIEERERIRLRKASMKGKPWTDDEILQNYRFCNVRRMDDKVSQWLLENWYRPYYADQNMLIACLLARHFNLPSTLEAIGFPVKWKPIHIMTQVRILQSQGVSVFNGAYMIRGLEGMDKVEMVVTRVIQPIVKDGLYKQLDYGDMQASVEILIEYWGLNTFLAGQVVADLRHAAEGTWKDRNTWAPRGPGSMRGLNRLQGRSLGFKPSDEQFNRELSDITRALQELIPKSIWSRLEAIDYQNCLCEFDKYTRVLTGEGKPKQRYNGAKI